MGLAAVKAAVQQQWTSGGADASREPKGRTADMADRVEKQPHREGADGEEATNCTKCCWSANYK